MKNKKNYIKKKKKKKSSNRSETQACNHLVHKRKLKQMYI